MEDEDSKADSRTSSHFLREALKLYLPPTNDPRRPIQIPPILSGGPALHFGPHGGGPLACPTIYPPSTSHCKEFSSSTFTCVMHLCQNSSLKQYHGSILCSPGGPWGPGCPAGPGCPGGPSPGAPGGPCKPWRPGRPGSPAERQVKYRPSYDAV